MTINLDELERIATAGDPWGYAATPKNILELVAEVRRLREETDSLMTALADCREAAFVEEIDNPYLAGAVGDPLEVPRFVTYAVEWLTGMVEIAKGRARAKDQP